MLIAIPSSPENMEINSCMRFKRHHQVVENELDNEITLFQSESSEYLVLNKTGSFIWKALESQPTFSQLCQRIHLKYAVSPQKAESELKEWLDLAIKKKVVISYEDTN